MGHLELEEVGRRAAELYGQQWDALPVRSQEKWRAAIQAAEATPDAAGETMMEHCAQTAYREWCVSPKEPQKVSGQGIEEMVEKTTKSLAKDADRKPVVKIDPEQPKTAPKNKK